MRKEDANQPDSCTDKPAPEGVGEPLQNKRSGGTGLCGEVARGFGFFDFVAIKILLKCRFSIAKAEWNSYITPVK